MTREIRFRAFVKKTGRYVAGTMWSWEELKDNYPCEINFNKSVLGLGLFHEEKPIILMQWTGLLDKNGVEIYEGDILKLWVGDKPKTVGNITWGGWEYTVTMEVAGKDKTNYFGYNSEDIDPDKIEVIGNIYENPDLL